jgi:hypothetical protein
MLTGVRILGLVLITAMATALISSSPLLMHSQLAQGCIKCKNNYAHVRVPIAISGDNVYLTWWDNKTGNNEVFFARSTDNGKTFEPTINLSNATGASADNEISAQGDNVYVTWWDNQTGNWEVFTRASTDNGETFNDAVMLNGLADARFKLIPPPSDRIAIDSLVASSGNNQYVVWWDNKTGYHEVQFAKSSDNGKTFGNTTNISDSPDMYSIGARIAAEGNNVYVTWFDTKEGGAQKNAFFRASNDNGDTFGNRIMLNSTGTS